MRPRRQARALKENLQRCLSVSLLSTSWGGSVHYHQPPFEHPLFLFVAMLFSCCQHNILIRCPLARKPQRKYPLIVNCHVQAFILQMSSRIIDSYSKLEDHNS